MCVMVWWEFTVRHAHVGWDRDIIIRHICIHTCMMPSSQPRAGKRATTKHHAAPRYPNERCFKLCKGHASPSSARCILHQSHRPEPCIHHASTRMQPYATAKRPERNLGMWPTAAKYSPTLVTQLRTGPWKSGSQCCLVKIKNYYARDTPIVSKSRTSLKSYPCWTIVEADR